MTDPRSQDDHRTYGQLVAQATQDVSALVRYEIALAKAEVKDDVAKAGTGAGLLAAAATAGLLGLVLALLAAAWGIEAAGLPAWAGHLIVAGVLVLVAAVLALVGRSRLKGISKPERTIDAAKSTLEALKGRS